MLSLYASWRQHAALWTTCRDDRCWPFRTCHFVCVVEPPRHVVETAIWLVAPTARRGACTARKQCHVMSRTAMHTHRSSFCEKTPSELKTWRRNHGTVMWDVVFWQLLLFTLNSLITDTEISLLSNKFGKRCAMCQLSNSNVAANWTVAPVKCH